jgi:BlaI family penicillinase repressor
MRENGNKESKVSKALRRFEENGTITHRVDGHADMNEAFEPRGRSAVRAVRRIVDWVCNGSVEEVLVGMVDTDMINRKQLRMLADRIGRRKPGRK